MILLGFSNAGKSFWLPKANLNLLNEAFENIFWGKAIYFIVIALFVLGLFFMIRRYKLNTSLQSQLLVYSAFIGLLSFLLLFFAGKLTPVFHSRYLIFTVPFFIIIISWFLTSTFKWLPALIPVLLLLQLFFLNPNPKKGTDYRTCALVANKLREAEPSSMILLETKDITGLFTYYYQRNLYMDYWHMRDNITRRNIFDISSSADLDKLDLSKANTIIFCQSFDNADDNRKIADFFSQNHYAIAISKAVSGVTISLLKKKR
ncbi:MAG: hypothetical protein ACXVDK_03425 [Bacteroidia bacterium]